MRTNDAPRLLLALWLAVLPVAGAMAAEPSTADEELRGTVINLLEALVQKNILTREQAQGLVADAQQKAAAAAQRRAAGAAAAAETDKDAVRVTYVPQIVKDEIAKDVSGQIRSDITAQVLERTRTEFSVPEWIRSARIYGDVRARAENALYADGNADNFYLNFAAINSSGGFNRAGLAALLNTTEDRPRMVGRVRLGAAVQLGSTLRADLRLASGNLASATSTNQTLGNYGQRWTIGVDKAALIWNPRTESLGQELELRAGRFESPFLTSSEMIWDADLMFEGLSTGWSWNRVEDGQRRSRWLFVTAGAFPLQEIELATKDKWLFGGQIGTELPFFGRDSRLRIAGAYYDYQNITGVDNALDSRLLDYTAPPLLTKGNTLFDIRNDNDPTTNLYALAGKYRLATGLIQLDMLAYGTNHLIVTGEYVKNIGWKTSDVLLRSGENIAARTEGYEASISFGRTRVASFGDWRAAVGYRYLQRDAVLDAFTDSDFHLGGTDAKGYSLQLDMGLGRSAYARFRYLTADEIDGAPLGIDVVQLDFVGQF